MNKRASGDHGEDAPRQAARSITVAFPPSLNARRSWQLLEETYPAIAKHLAPFAKAGEARFDKGEYWWELRACNYYDKFDEPKIITPTITQKGGYLFDSVRWFSNDKTNIIVSQDKYLLALLNSRTLDFVLHSIAPTRQGGFYEYKPTYRFEPIRVSCHAVNDVAKPAKNDNGSFRLARFPCGSINYDKICGTEDIKHHNESERTLGKYLRN